MTNLYSDTDMYCKLLDSQGVLGVCILWLSAVVSGWNQDGYISKILIVNINPLEINKNRLQSRGFIKDQPLGKLTNFEQLL